jgi:putative ABC transport system permease protein
VIIGHLLTLAIRGLWRYRATTAMNLFALVLGLFAYLYATGAAMQVRNADSLWPNADRIVQLTQQTTPRESGITSEVLPTVSHRAEQFLRADYPALEGISRMFMVGERALIHGNRYAFPQVIAVDEDFTRIFIWPLRLGDWATALARPDGVILPPQIAQSLFGGEDPMGKTVTIKGRDLFVTGVLDDFPAQMSQFDMADKILVGREVGLFLDYHTQPKPEDWLETWTPTFALLPAGLSVAEFNKQLADFGKRHVPEDVARTRFAAVPLTAGMEVAVNSGLRTSSTGLTYTMLMLGLGLMVLFVASLNYANLTAAVAAARAREMGLRKLLGESWHHILGQGLIEAGILSFFALTLLVGILLALSPLSGHVPNMLNWFHVFQLRDFWVLTALGVGVATLSGGLYPAQLMARAEPLAVIQGSKGNQRTGKLSALLVGLQFFAASILLIAGLVAWQQNALMQQAFNPTKQDILLYVRTVPDGHRFREIHDHLANVPGVMAVSGRTVQWPEQAPVALGTAREGGARMEVFQNGVGPDFFNTIGTRIIAGRDFSLDRADDVEPIDSKKNMAVSNVIIDRTLADAQGWTPETAIGKTLYEFGPNWVWQVTVVGVVEDRPVNLNTAGPRGTIYHFQGDNVWFPIIRIARQNAPQTMTAIGDAMNRLSPDKPIKLESEEVLLASQSANIKSTAIFFGGLALFTFAIAVVGLSGMAFHVTGLRMREIGIRKTLGAGSWSIFWLLLLSFVRPVVLATILAWPFAYLAGQAYLSLFVKRESLSAWPFLASLLVSLVVALLAVGLQVVRASRRNPAAILRYE